MNINMKTLMGFLGAALVAATCLTATPIRGAVETYCRCQSCQCTPNNHCGCFFQTGRQGSYSCKCADSCTCVDNCSYNNKCKCN